MVNPMGQRLWATLCEQRWPAPGSTVPVGALPIYSGTVLLDRTQRLSEQESALEVGWLIGIGESGSAMPVWYSWR